MHDREELSIPYDFIMASTPETLLSSKLELLHDMLELTLHRSHNRMTVGSSHVDLLAMAPSKISEPEHLNALAKVFQESAELHSRLVKLSRRTISPPRDDLLLSTFLKRTQPMLELAAHSRHRKLHIISTSDVGQTLLPGEASVWLELALLKLCRAPHVREQTSMTLSLSLSHPSIQPHPELDTRPRPLTPQASHLRLTMDRVLTMQDFTWRTSLFVMLEHLIGLRPGALWIDQDTMTLELALSHRVITQTSPAPSIKTRTRQGAAPMRCVIIDDEPAMLGPLKRILKYQGYEVSTFSSPLKALDHVHTTQATFDIALVDYAMNELNGLQTLDALRQHQPDLRAIIITGMPDDDLLDTLSRDPLSSTLSKPWNMTTLLKLLSVHLENDPES